MTRLCVVPTLLGVHNCCVLSTIRIVDRILNAAGLEYANREAKSVRVAYLQHGSKHWRVLFARLAFVLAHSGADRDILSD